MARDGGGMGSIIGIAAAAGLAYWAYSTGMLSSIFGTTTTSAADAAAKAAADAAAKAAADAAGAAGSGAGTNVQSKTTTDTTQTQTGPCPLTGVLAPALALAAKQQGWADPNAATSVLSMDQWNYFLGQVCTGLPAQVGAALDAGQVFPGDAARGGPLNWLAYSGYAKQAGLSGPQRGSGAGTRLVRRGMSCC